MGMVLGYTMYRRFTLGSLLTIIVLIYSNGPCSVLVVHHLIDLDDRAGLLKLPHIISCTRQPPIGSALSWQFYLFFLGCIQLEHLSNEPEAKDTIGRRKPEGTVKA